VRKFKTFINLEQPLLKEANKLANLQEALKLITSVVNACINPVNTGVTTRTQSLKQFFTK